MTEPIRIHRSTTRKPKPKDADLGFGQIFTDHMFVADFQEEKGWYDPRIEPYGPLSLDPATAILFVALAAMVAWGVIRVVSARARRPTVQWRAPRLHSHTSQPSSEGQH